MKEDNNTVLYVVLGLAVLYMLNKTKLVSAATPSAPALPPPSLMPVKIQPSAPAPVNIDMGGQDFGIVDPTTGW